jgi:hypothetical protein
MSDRWRARFPKDTPLKNDEREVIFSFKDRDGRRIERVGIMKAENAETLDDLISYSFVDRLGSD